MSLIKLSRLSSEDLYTRATASVLKNHSKDPDWNIVNAKAKKIKDRYNKFADHIRNKNIKRGLVVGGLIGLSAYIHKKHKDK